MNKHKISVSIFSTSMGHYSLGKAVEDKLDKDLFDIKFNYIKPDESSVKLYQAFYHVFPPLFKVPFKLGKNKKLQTLIFLYLNKVYEKILKEKIESQNPKIIVNTYFGFCNILEKICRDKNISLFNIVADPRTFHDLETAKYGVNMVFDDIARNNLLKINGARVKAVTSGWFIRKEFHTDYDKSEVRKKLLIPRNRFTISIIGGSSGSFNIVKILPALLNPPRAINAVFICGKSKKLLSAINRFKKLTQFVNKNDNLLITNLSFRENVHEYIQASDLVMGKAGPNLMFETVACGVPFMAVSHISGQEDGNLEIIRQKKLGIVEENPGRLMTTLRKIIKNPETLKKYQLPINKMAKYNRNSGRILNEHLMANFPDLH